MRSYWAPLALIGLTLAAHGLWGQAPPPLQAPSLYPRSASILVSQADVYSAPGGALAYPTGRLRYGETVVVTGESPVPGWLVIVPPPGSFSWIEAKYVKTVAGMDRIGIVDTGDAKLKAPIMPGAANKQPSGVIAEVATGTQLLLLDRPNSMSGGVSWYPIVPVATEVRFLPLDAVRNGGSASNTTAYGSTIPAGWQTPAGPAASPAVPFYELAKQGDQALAAGNPERARFLYIEAIAQTNDLAWRNYLHAQLAKVTPNNGPQSAPFQTASSPAGARPVTPSSWNPSTSPAAPSSVPPAAPNTKTWSPDGYLRGTGFTTTDGQPMYVLEHLQTRVPQMYVAAQKGYSLQTLVGQIVTIYGTLVPRNDPNINMQLLIAENLVVRSAPAK